MSQQRVSGAALMLIMCLLPILVFYFLLLFGITISPLIVLLMLVLCCMVMFHWSAGACGHHAPETAEATAADEESIPIGEVELEQLSGIFRPISRRQVGHALVVEGELLRDAENAYESLKAKFQDTNVTPLLQEDELQQPRVVDAQHLAAQLRLESLIRRLVEEQLVPPADEGLDLGPSAEPTGESLLGGQGPPHAVPLHGQLQLVAQRSHLSPQPLEPPWTAPPIRG